MSDRTTLGDYLKAIEGTETARRLVAPVYARIDGRSFSRFTRGMCRPFDPRLSRVMQEVTRFLVAETGATVGYTQSDEISLAWVGCKPFFDGKIQKMVSQLAALASSKFVLLALNEWPERVRKSVPTFDARVFPLDNEADTVKCFVWRERDATKNAANMAASTVFSHRRLLNQKTESKVEMLAGAGVSFGDYPAFFRRGAYFARREQWRDLTSEELDKIPEQYRPAGPVNRPKVIALDLPPLDAIENQADVLFRGSAPGLRIAPDRSPDRSPESPDAGGNLSR